MYTTTLRLAAVALGAFVIGAAASRATMPARAAAAALAPTVIDLGALAPADLPTPGAMTPNLRSKPLVAADGMTAGIQIGTVFKHLHAEANEVQYVVAGSGTEWLGDRQIARKPGLLIIIPAGTPHGGTVDPSLKILAIKTPPQAAADIRALP